MSRIWDLQFGTRSVMHKNNMAQLALTKDARFLLAVVAIVLDGQPRTATHQPPHTAQHSVTPLCAEAITWQTRASLSTP